MFNLHPLSRGVLVASLVIFGIVPHVGAVVDDSTRAVVHDAVSANQRATSLVAAAYRTMASDPLEAHGNATRAVAQAERSGDALVEHKALVCLGKVEERMGLSAERMKTALNALRSAQEIGDPLLIAVDLRELANAYRLNGMPDKAVEEARNSLAMMMPTRPIGEVEEARVFLIRTLSDAGQFDEAYRMAERTIALARERDDVLLEARLARVLGDILTAQGRFSDAVPYLAQAERQLGTQGSAKERFELYCAMARAYVGMGRTKEADAAVAQVALILPEVENWSNTIQLMDLRYRSASARKDWRGALHMLERIKVVSDSVQHAGMDLQLARMQVSYQLDRKEKANEELRTENAKSASLIAGTERFNKLLLGLAVLLSALVVVLVLGVRYYLRMNRRMKLKTAVIKRQHDEIHGKNLELQRQNLRLAETLMSEEEKEMMIKEIHHRVKNNLQVVDSLLQIQCFDSSDAGVNKVLRTAQGRIRSMAMVHEHIYRTNSGEQADLRSHLEKLTRNILVAHGVHDRISARVDTVLPVFHMDTLLPFTLVVNELFTNAVKYAFNAQDIGRITIIVRPSGAGFELLFNDDGAGMPLDETHQRERSFGLELVRMLAEQLNGNIQFLNGTGTTVCMAFVPDPVQLKTAS